MPKIRVLIVDDSAVMRHFLSRELSLQPGIDVLGTAPDAYVARNKIINLKPDVLTVDIQMPRMDGVTFIDKMMKHHPMPIVVFSSFTKSGAELTLNALDAGAIDYMQKPASMADAARTVNLLARKIKAASKVSPKKISPSENNKNVHSNDLKPVIKKGIIDDEKIIAIGASTGGTNAIKEILTKLPENFPPIVIVQHMPAYFTKSFADRLNAQCEVEVKEARNGEKLQHGTALIAPGDYHMELKMNGSGYVVKTNQNRPVNNQRPSVDVLFNSVAGAAGKNAVGVILTGMGGDGAKGLLEMKKAGAFTVAQDKSTSVVFGMPKQAIRIGAIDQIAELTDIPNILYNQIRSEKVC